MYICHLNIEAGQLVPVWRGLLWTRLLSVLRTFVASVTQLCKCDEKLQVCSHMYRSQMLGTDTGGTCGEMKSSHIRRSDPNTPTVHHGRLLVCVNHVWCQPVSLSLSQTDRPVLTLDPT